MALQKSYRGRGKGMRESVAFAIRAVKIFHSELEHQHMDKTI